jgi:peptidyl-prolyl cis-trans isomerase A (cyclophilin A)
MPVLPSDGPGRRRQAVAAIVLALTPACVFVPPPPLPGEEGYDQGALGSGAEPARLGGPAQGPAGVAADASREGGAPSRFTKGQEPPVGMSISELVEFNAAQGDPVEGFFELDEALAGIPGEGELWVEFVTRRGVMDCRLYEQLTPLTVANFVGLARGLRPWYDRDLDEWVTGEPYYDDTTFHRVIPGFMIQGGDPTATGRGNPGYVIPDELHPELGHDEGALSMANKGRNTGSAQFFIVLEPAVHLDRGHTVFGRCTASAMVIAEQIANVAVGDMDKPVTDEVVEVVRFVRRPAKK